MTKVETRAVEVRIEADPERQGPGILKGVLMPYGERASDRAEVFDRGSLTWPEGGVVLRAQHDRNQPLARFEPIDQGESVAVAIRLPETQAGRDAATNVREGVYRGLSVEFIAKAEARQAGVRHLQRALLVGAGLVDDPSYTGATVAVRHRRTTRRVWL